MLNQRFNCGSKLFLGLKLPCALLSGESCGWVWCGQRAQCRAHSAFFVEEEGVIEGSNPDLALAVICIRVPHPKVVILIHHSLEVLSGSSAAWLRWDS